MTLLSFSNIYSQTTYCSVLDTNASFNLQCGSTNTNVTLSRHGFKFPFSGTRPTSLCGELFKLGWYGVDTIMTNGHTYTFSPAVSKIRVKLGGIDSAETINIYINGQKFHVTTQHISPVTCTSLGNNQINAVIRTAKAINGSVSFDTLHGGVHPYTGADGQVDIDPGYAIQSVTIEQSGYIIQGTGFHLQVSMDTTVYLPMPFTDTLLCAGDSFYLSYHTALKFKPNNTFTAQLSDASGSFTSPTTIGSISSDTTGFIPCKIPANAVGSGYRIRVLASNPAKTSLDNGIDIKIGNISPTNVSASGTNSICLGDSIKLYANTNTNSVNYSWSGPNSYLSNNKNPIISPSTLNMSGDYILNVSYFGCSVFDTVNVLVNPRPNIPTANNNNPTCVGGTIMLTASTTTSNATYQWSGPNNYTSSNQNPNIPLASLAMAGDYIVYADLGGCKSVQADTTTVVVQKGAQMSIAPSPSNSICPGDSITFLAIITDAVNGSTYHWEKNGTKISGVNALSFKTNDFKDGDVIACILTPGPTSGCTTPVSSLQIPIVINNYLAPTVNISVAPSSNVWEGLLVTFTADPTDAGFRPKYQWKLNGADIIGATGKTWAATTLTNGDEVTCEITSDYLCPKPENAISNSIKMNVALNVEKLTTKENKVSLYPNPANSKIKVTGLKSYTYEVYDLSGRLVLSGNSNGDEVNISKINNGIYFMSILTTNNTYKLKLIKK